MRGGLKIKDIEREETIIFTYVNKTFKGKATIQAANYNFGYENKNPGKTNIVLTFLIPIE